MNPDEAYRMQTDWARAVLREGSPTRDWMARRTWEVTQQMTDDAHRSRRLSAPILGADALRRVGPLREVSLVIGYRPDSDLDPDALPTDVYEDVTEPEPGTVPPTDLIIPEKVYTPATPVMLANAPTYYVTADMVTVMEVAAAAFDKFDLMPRLPASSGFVVLARPIELPMPGGTTQPVRAFAWNTWGTVQTTMGTPGDVGEVWTFASRKRDAGFVMVEKAAEMWPSKKAWDDAPDLLPCYGDWVAVGVPLPPIAEPSAVGDAHVRAHRWVGKHYPPKIGRDGKAVVPSPEQWEAQLTAMQARYDQYHAEAMAKNPDDQYGYFQPYLAAFILLLTQQITAVAKEPVLAGTARLGRQVSRTRPSDVTVVDLWAASRSAEREGPQRGVLTARHLVGAHWKWQPYGEKSSLRRRIFVAGYVRGPVEAPLVVKPRVTRL